MTAQAQGLRSVYQGDFGEMWVETVAACVEYLHGRPTTIDMDKADVLVQTTTPIAGVLDPEFRAQVKTTKKLNRNKDGSFSYNLDLKSYEYLRKRGYKNRRILIVIGIEDRTRFEVSDEGTLLKGTAVWLSLEGMESSENQNGVTLRIPPENVLDENNLRHLMTTYGVPASSNVNEYKEGDEI